jgi:hypothetical protein
MTAKEFEKEIADIGNEIAEFVQKLKNGVWKNGRDHLCRFSLLIKSSKASLFFIKRQFLQRK